MRAEIQHVYVKTPHIRQMRHAAKLMENGAVIIYPTDTVYGLAADVRNKKAVDRLFKIKDIPRHKPLSLVFEDLTKIAEFANLENPVFRIMKRVLPGPYTFILPVSNNFPKIISPKRETIGVRVPDCPVCQALTSCLGGPLLSTSLPKLEGVYISQEEKIVELYGADSDLILIGDVIKNVVSTVLDFSVDPPVILRKGAGDIVRLGAFPGL